jgi:hypothetical protein
MKLYTITEVRQLAGTKDIFRTKRGYIYKLVNSKKVYITSQKEIG